MRLSERRIQQMARGIVDHLLEGDLIDVDLSEERLRESIAVMILSDLQIEDEIDAEAMERIKTYSRPIPEGSSEWMILMERFRDEIAKRRRYVFG
jgi:hypothetical protein